MGVNPDYTGIWVFPMERNCQLRRPYASKTYPLRECPRNGSHGLFDLISMERKPEVVPQVPMSGRLQG